MHTMLRSLALSALRRTVRRSFFAHAQRVQPLGENVAAPRFVVGDHWEYLVTDGLRRGATTRLDVQVVAINSGCRDHAIGERRQLRSKRANGGDRRRRRPACRRACEMPRPGAFRLR